MEREASQETMKDSVRSAESDRQVSKAGLVCSFLPVSSISLEKRKLFGTGYKGKGKKIPLLN